MWIFLPKHQNGMDRLLENINCYVTNPVINPQLQEKEMRLQIPKFVMEYKIDMVDILKSLNILKVFNPGATLYGMVNEGSPLYVSQIFHSNKIVLNEDGNEESALPPGNATTNFTADHPFLFFIKNMTSRSMLFAGKYMGP